MAPTDGGRHTVIARALGATSSGRPPRASSATLRGPTRSRACPFREFRDPPAGELLGLNEAEEALVDAKLKLGDAVRALRQRRHLSQTALAKLIGSSQSRVAKLENRDPEVSLDLQMKAIFAASPGALRDFQGLIRKWSVARQSRQPAAAAGGARGRR